MQHHYTLADQFVWFLRHHYIQSGLFMLAGWMLWDKVRFLLKRRQAVGWRFHFDLKTVLHLATALSGLGAVAHTWAAQPWLEDAARLLEAACK